MSSSEDIKKEATQEEEEQKAGTGGEYDNKILKVVQKYFKEATIGKVDDLEIKDISGMSNANYIVNPKDDPEAKVVVRFFKSKCSNFDNERAIFRKMGQKGYGPKEIEANNHYRIEEYIDGRPLTWLELRNPWIQSTLMELICDTNYDDDLHGVIQASARPDAHYLLDVTFDKNEGWYHKYVKEVQPKLMEQDLSEHPRAKEIANFFN